MSRKNKFFISVSPLGLLAVSACGGGSTSGSSGPTFTAFTTSGFAQSGPLGNARVFLDYDQDGTFDVGVDTEVDTGADGSFSLTTTEAGMAVAALNANGTYNIVVTTNNDAFGNSSTVDSSIGGTVSNIHFVAPSGEDNLFGGANVMVTPATTMIAELMRLDATLTASDAKDNVSKALGFTQSEIDGGFDPFTFNAFDPLQSGDAYEALALKTELTSKKNHDSSKYPSCRG
jgi:hypothetical protein